MAESKATGSHPQLLHLGRPFRQKWARVLGNSCYTCLPSETPYEGAHHPFSLPCVSEGVPHGPQPPANQPQPRSQDHPALHPSGDSDPLGSLQATAPKTLMQLLPTPIL